jgi:hypothetical protein
LNLLLVAYYFPPEPVAGALRPGYLATYLREFGWNVTVLTRPLAQERARHIRAIPVVTAPVLGDSLERSVRGALDAQGESRTQRPSPLRRALRWAKKTLTFPDRAAGWAPAAFARGCGIARRRPFDAVISTATPATAHLVGASLAARLRVPWIADYRDPWAGNPGVGDGPVRARLQHLVERSVLRRASAITTISAPIAATLEAIHRRPVTVIPNASDPSDWQGLEAIVPQRFELCYTGSLYAEHRTPRLLFEALAALRSESDPAATVRVVFYGPANDHLMQEARRFGVEDLVEYRGIVPRAQAIAAQREASDLLIFLNMDPSTTFELGSKIIEYARARRPILAFGPAGSVVRDYLARHAMGWFASDLDEAKSAVREAYRTFTNGRTEIEPPPDADYTARDLAKAFAQQLDAVL